MDRGDGEPIEITKPECGIEGGGVPGYIKDEFNNLMEGFNGDFASPTVRETDEEKETLEGSVKVGESEGVDKVWEVSGLGEVRGGGRAKRRKVGAKQKQHTTHG